MLRRTAAQIDWTRTLALLNTVAFVALGVSDYAKSDDPRLYANEQSALRISAALLGIAGVHYAALEASRPNVEAEIVIRYSDWLLTTPLLLLVVANLYELDAQTSALLVALDVLMIVLGFAYEQSGSMLYWTISTAAYVLLLVVLYQALPEHSLFWPFFVLGWGLYGFVALLPPAQRLNYFNVLDFYNKFVFALAVNAKIQERAKLRSEK